VKTAIAAVTLFVLTPAFAGASPQQATIAGLVGTWTCVTHTSGNQTYHETDVDSLFGNWLRIDATYPASAGAPASTSVTFLGYDSKRGRWVVTGVGTDGSYFTSTSTSPAYDGSKWTDQFPNDHGTALVRMTQSTQYSLDVQTPDDRGKMSTAHAVCTKH
jgi:hypothetical protein